jgi:hypothetical protein
MDCDAGVAMGFIKRVEDRAGWVHISPRGPKNPPEESNGEGDTNNLVKVISLGELTPTKKSPILRGLEGLTLDQRPSCVNKSVLTYLNKDTPHSSVMPTHASKTD